MRVDFSRSQVAVAIAAAFGVASLGAVSVHAEKPSGTYAAGDFHNHTTCSDGSISMQKLVKKATDKQDTPWGLDWFVQAGHGGNGNRNCTLVEDPAYPGGSPISTDPPGGPLDPALNQGPYPLYPAPKNSPQTTWATSIGAANVKGNAANGGVALSTQANPSMWRWQSIQEFQYPLLEYMSVAKDLPLFIGMESVVAGHEHTSMSVITGQMPADLTAAQLPTSPQNIAPEYRPYIPKGNADALAQWSYCFDRGDTDWSRGNKSIAEPTGNNWDCSVPGSANSADANWNPSARKLVNNTGDAGHNKTLEALKWMDKFHSDGSYYVPAHLERAGPFNASGSNGYNIEHLRDFNNTAPDVAFGFETQPGHHASDQRGEYTIRRNNFGSSASPNRLDSVGGTTWGGTGVYGAMVGGVWDALLGEGRNWWFFASSDWHNRGTFGPDDRRSTQDFYPGEYQRNYTMVRNGSDRKLGPREIADGLRSGRHDPRLRPQAIVDGLRGGNNFTAMGQLIDRLSFVACIGNPGPHGRSNQAVEQLALQAALDNTDVDFKGCATMGEKLQVPRGADVVVSIVLRDPAGTNYSPYTFNNPSLAQVGLAQPINAPVLDHVDVIRGMVTSLTKQRGDANYAGAWPDGWLDITANPQVQPSLTNVPLAARNATASVIKTFNDTTWTALRRDPQYKVMTFRIPGVGSSQYLRLRGSDLPPSVPFETDANGNPLADLWTNAASVSSKTGTGAAATEFPAGYFLRIPCTTPHSANSQFDGCPDHLPSVTNQVNVAGYPNGYTGKMSAFDVAAWSDLWFYSNPIYIEVQGSVTIAGARLPGATNMASRAKSARVVADVGTSSSAVLAQAK